MKNPLRYFRFSLTGLFGATLFAACVVATLRYATRLWADGLFTLVLATVATAALGVVYRKGAARAFWIGALVGGGGYLFLAYGPWIGESVRPHLMTTPLLSMAYERLQTAFNPPNLPSYPPSYISTYSTPTTYYSAPAPTYGAPPVGGSPTTVYPIPNSQANSAPSGAVDPYSALPQAADPSAPPDAVPPAGGSSPQMLPDGSLAPPPGLPSSDGISGTTVYNYSQPSSAYMPAGAYDPYAVPPQLAPYQASTYAPALVSTLPDWDDLERAGHSLTALLAAFIFALTARRFHRTRSPATADLQ